MMGKSPYENKSTPIGIISVTFTEKVKCRGLVKLKSSASNRFRSDKAGL